MLRLHLSQRADNDAVHDLRQPRARLRRHRQGERRRRRRRRQERERKGKGKGKGEGEEEQGEKDGERAQGARARQSRRGLLVCAPCRATRDCRRRLCSLVSGAPCVLRRRVFSVAGTGQAGVGRGADADARRGVGGAGVSPLPLPRARLCCSLRRRRRRRRRRRWRRRWQCRGVHHAGPWLCRRRRSSLDARVRLPPSHAVLPHPRLYPPLATARQRRPPRPAATGTSAARVCDRVCLWVWEGDRARSQCQCQCAWRRRRRRRR